MGALAFLRRFFEPDPRRETARALYRDISAKARDPALFDHGGVPDTFDGRFDMIVLHVFFVLRRLGGAGDAAKDLSQRVFDAAFTEFDDALRDIGVGDMSIGKKIKQMAEAFYGRIHAYEVALTALEEGAFEEALRRNVFRGRPVSVENLTFLAARARAFGDRLGQTPVERLLEGRL